MGYGTIVVIMRNEGDLGSEGDQKMIFCLISPMSSGTRT
jgi:hypothetical protein